MVSRCCHWVRCSPPTSISSGTGSSSSPTDKTHGSDGLRGPLSYLRFADRAFRSPASQYRVAYLRVHRDGDIHYTVARLLADRYGRKATYSRARCCSDSGNNDRPHDEFHRALRLRLLQGVGFAGMAPIIIASIGDRYTGAREATKEYFRFTISGVTQVSSPTASVAATVDREILYNTPTWVGGTAFITDE